MLVNLAPVRDFVYLASICYLTGELCVVDVSSESELSFLKRYSPSPSFLLQLLLYCPCYVQLFVIQSNVVGFCVSIHVDRSIITVF